MAPVVPFIPLITGVLGAAATVTGAVMANRQAEKAADQQAQYMEKAQKAQQDATAKEQKITQEAQQRARAYNASLLTSDTNLSSALTSGGYSSEGEENYSLLGSSLSTGSASNMFS